MSTGTMERTDISVDELTERFGGVPCQGRDHPLGVFGHQPGAKGAYLLVCPNCGPKVVQCEGRVRYMKREGAALHCGTCNLDSAITRWRFIPL